MADRYSIAIGTVFSHLTYLGQPEKASTGGGSTFLFQCSCGNLKRSRKSAVVHGKTVSCGCHKARLVSERRRSHGHSQDGAGSAYLTWQNMLRRCLSPSATGYADYGGRGISVCERWSKFENFLADMGERPAGMTIDRWPNKNGNYEPGNCRWATGSEQLYNTRRSHVVEYNGAKMTIGELASNAGVSANILRRRIIEGIPVEKAVSKASLAAFHVLEHGGFSLTIAEWTRKLGLNRGVIETRLRRGKTIEQALAPVDLRYRKK